MTVQPWQEPNPSADSSAPTDLERILEGQERMQATLDTILLKFEEVAGEVKPMIDTISKHPMVRMLGLNK